MTGPSLTGSLAAMTEKPKDPYACEVGQRLKLLRKAYDDSQDTFAGVLGTSRENYRFMEAGDQFPRPHHIRKLAADRGVDWNWVWSGDETNLRPDTKRKLDEYRKQRRKRRSTLHER